MIASPFRATRYVSSLDRIDLDELAGAGVRAILLDRDNTCIPRDTHVAPPEVTAWLRHARELGMALCLVSNNFHGAQVSADAQQLGCAVVDHAMKPAPFSVLAALALVGVPAEQAVLIGDQIFTDVLAGNLAGVDTILVHPQSTTDLWYTQVFRLGESLLLDGVSFEDD